MAKLVREKFTNCDPAAAVTAAFENGGYSARLTTGGDITNSKPGVTLVGSAADANEVYGEIKGRIDGNTVSVQTGGIARFRVLVASLADVAAIDAVIGQGVQAADATSSGLVEHSGTLGDGRGRIIGGELDGGVLYAVVDLDAD